jgi:NADPH-dependent curcumin reductase CurA
MTSLQIRLAARPTGLPDADTWEIRDVPIPDPREGQLRVDAMFVSLDPAMRGWLNDVRSYAPPVPLGEVMRAYVVGRVGVSRHPAFQEGELVAGMLGVQEHAISDGQGLIRVDPALASPPTWLGALGGPGLTAYFGLLDVAKLREGENVLVSGAAGAVGSVVGQIAKLKGCRVVGIAGGKEKCAWLVDELRFDAAIDYKTEEVSESIGRHLPGGVDVYFDNVGGPILDAALERLRMHARVVICGAISQYNVTGPIYGPTRYLSLLVNRASMTGMLVSDYLDQFPTVFAEIAQWIREGRLIVREQIVTGGIQRFPEALLMLFDGSNTGKLVLQVAE